MPTLRAKASRNFVPALLVTAAVVVGLNASIAFAAVSSLLKAQHLVEHTWQVMVQVERIMNSAKDAETGVRGYFVTGKESYLQPYLDAQKAIPPQLDQFQALTSDNPTQQLHIQQMRVVLQERMARLQIGLDTFRANGKNLQPVLALGGTGKARMDQLRELADQMEDEEQKLLNDRTADARANSLRTQYSIVIASGLDLLLILLTFRYFARERRLRLATQHANQELAQAHAESEARAQEIKSLNETLEVRVNIRTAELESANRELEAFSYSVSHDLRAPLRTIDGFSLALEEDYASIVDDTGRDYILRVRTSVQRMGQLIDSLLQLSRITRGEMTREEFDFTELATSVAQVLQEENPRRDMTFHIEEGLKATGDPRLLGIALQNLMGNAAKFSSRMPHTVIEFGWDEDKQAWFVRDNGAGFDMYYKDKLFHAFNRLHGDKDFKGSGIGLATVARVIQRHQGQIWADSVIDQGATFWFTLGG